MRNIGTLAGHDVVGLGIGELEGVVAAKAAMAVDGVTADAGHIPGMVRLEIGDCVEVPLSWTANTCSSKVNLRR